MSCALHLPNFVVCEENVISVTIPGFFTRSRSFWHRLGIWVFFYGNLGFSI